MAVMISGILYECKRAHWTTWVSHVGIKLGSCLLSCLIQIHRSIRQRTLHGVPVNKEITIVLSLFRSHWLAVYCLVFCITSCVPVHEDRTPFCQLVTRDISQFQRRKSPGSIVQLFFRTSLFCNSDFLVIEEEMQIDPSKPRQGKLLYVESLRSPTPDCKLG